MEINLPLDSLPNLVCDVMVSQAITSMQLPTDSCHGPVLSQRDLVENAVYHDLGVMGKSPI